MHICENLWPCIDNSLSPVPVCVQLHGISGPGSQAGQEQSLRYAPSFWHYCCPMRHRRAGFR